MFQIMVQEYSNGKLREEPISLSEFLHRLNSQPGTVGRPTVSKDVDLTGPLTEVLTVPKGAKVKSFALKILAKPSKGASIALGADKDWGTTKTTDVGDSFQEQVELPPADKDVVVNVKVNGLKPGETPSGGKVTVVVSYEMFNEI